MSLIFDISAFGAVATGVSCSFILQYRLNRREKSLAELKRLNWAREKLREHGEALDRFMFRPDAPQNLKAFLLSASDAFESRDFARFIANRIKERHDSGQNEPESDLWPELSKLYADDGETYDLFVEALFSGLTASLLRWPETAAVVSVPHAPTRDFIRQEVDSTARAIRERSLNNWAGGMIPV